MSDSGRNKDPTNNNIDLYESDSDPQHEGLQCNTLIATLSKHPIIKKLKLMLTSYKTRDLLNYPWCHHVHLIGMTVNRYMSLN